jgi:hypothetical protein
MKSVPKKEKSEEYAYVIPGAYPHLTLHIQKSANAWWMDSTKLYRLIYAFDHNVASMEEACKYADITLRQYRYFIKIHPIAEERRMAPHHALSIAAKHERAKKIQNGDGKAALEYLAEKYPYEYSLRHHRTPQADLLRKHGFPARKQPLGNSLNNVEETRESFNQSD